MSPNDDLNAAAELPSSPSSDAATPRQPGISGKAVTSTLVVILVGSLLTIGSLLWRYQQVTDARETMTQAWPKFAESLDRRYRALDRLVADGTDSQELDLRWSERFASARGRFSGSGSLLVRGSAAAEIEDLLRQDSIAPTLEKIAAAKNQTSIWPQSPSEVTNDEAAFEAARLKFATLLTGPIGGTIAYLFNMKTPEPISVFSNTPSS